MGPFVPFEVARSRVQNVPEEYIKNTHWGIVDGDESYHVKSQVEGDEHWYPVEFISARACWVEICWHENLEQGGHWEAFRIAGPDLGLDITPADLDRYIARQLAPRESNPAPENTTPSRPATPSSRSSSPSIIRVHHTPAVDAVTRLATELRIEDFPMMETQTTTTTIREGAINPLTGHMYTNDDVATFCALQPDRLDPHTRIPHPICVNPGQGKPWNPRRSTPGRRWRRWRRWRRRWRRRRRWWRTPTCSTHSTSSKSRRQTHQQSTIHVYRRLHQIRSIHERLEKISSCQQRYHPYGGTICQSYVVPHIHTRGKYH